MFGGKVRRLVEIRQVDRDQGAKVGRSTRGQTAKSGQDYSGSEPGRQADKSVGESCMLHRTIWQ